MKTNLIKFKTWDELLNSKCIIICYAERKVWESRIKALEKFRECYLFSDGHEKQRYLTILNKLISSESYVISDGCDDIFGYVTEYKLHIYNEFGKHIDTWFYDSIDDAENDWKYFSLYIKPTLWKWNKELRDYKRIEGY